jgi:phage host-nuclease inhibitor protein Gam
VDWQDAAPVELSESDLEKGPVDQADFATLPPVACKTNNYEAWKRSLADSLYRNQKLAMFRSPSLNLVSRPNEAERDFRLRLQQAAREERDQRKETLREKYAPRIASLQEKIRKAQQAVEREAQQVTQQKFQTAISFGTTLLGAFLGRRTVSVGTLGRATTAARGVSRTMRESQDVARAQESAGVLEQQMADLNAEFEAETQALESKIDPLAEKLETIFIRPKKSDISVSMVILVWAPHWQKADGSLTKAWE